MFFQESFMGNKLYVGNLPYSFRDQDLEQTFSQFGSVGSAKVMMERDTGRSKGFGFVEMGSDAEAQAAIQGVHGQNFGGRDHSTVIYSCKAVQDMMDTDMIFKDTVAELEKKIKMSLNE
jgi:RNA recognition motif-containing protein